MNAGPGRRAGMQGPGPPWPLRRRAASHLPPPSPCIPRHLLTTVPSPRVALMPMSTSSSSVTPCSATLCPMVTRSPITVSASCSPGAAAAVRTSVPSWMLVSAPTRIDPASPACAGPWRGRVRPCGTQHDGPGASRQRPGAARRAEPSPLALHPNPGESQHTPPFPHATHPSARSRRRRRPWVPA